MIVTSKQHVNKYKLQTPYLEKDLQGKIGRWINEKLRTFNLPEELLGSLNEVKISTGGTIAFSKFEDQQIPSLMKSDKSGLYHKMTDASFGSKPGDFVITKGGYIFCQFWKNRQQEICYYMDIRSVIIKVKLRGEKSIKETDFMLHGHKINLADYKVGIKKK